MVKKQPKKRLHAKINVDDVKEAMEDEMNISKMKTVQTKGARRLTKKGEKKDDDDDAEDLFTVDTKGSFEGISKSSRRELARAKLFPPKGEKLGLTATEEGKVLRAERQVEASKRPPKPEAAEVFDLWGAPAPNKISGRNGFGRVKTIAKVTVKTPGTLHQKVGLAPAVIPAHEGQSVNPHREAYEDLAFMAAAAELEREREADELERKMRPMTAELMDAVGAEKLKDMDDEEKIALYKKLHKRDGDAGEGEDEDGAAPSKRSLKRKSQAYRNKLKRKKMFNGADSKIEQAEAQKRLDRSVADVPHMLKGMKEQDEFHKNRKLYRENLRAKRKEIEASEGVVPKHRKLGGGKYAEAAAIVPEAESGGKGLRSMPVITSAVRERLESVVRRGLLPPPSEATAEKQRWHKKKNNKLKRGRKFISPLLKDNLLLR